MTKRERSKKKTKIIKRKVN
ncbi:hypothetical protein PFMC_03914 [Plasmodium falciparum CAMP/Malaysia]|uniref:Uncharacterized protein n=1 Tax=Plasmodium falciparum (isolate Camp / Malaysia) TaxID=5835 RepID=A0A024X3M4_PLAFC|nr:hypothetical protein PFMC_03914 [Plasmodium falciparum CAMP/Malaysia]